MTTYANLKAYVSGFAHRQDLNNVLPGTTPPVTLMDFFFQQAHNTILSKIDWQSLEKSEVLLASTATNPLGKIYALPLPATALTVRTVTSNGRDIQYLPPGRLQNRYGRAESGGDGQPLAYSVVGRDLWLAPGVVDSLVVYQNAEPAMINDDDENIIAQIYPNLYIWGALKELHTYVQDEEEMQKAMMMFTAEMENVNALASRTKYGNAPAMAAL